MVNDVLAALAWGEGKGLTRRVWAPIASMLSPTGALYRDGVQVGVGRRLHADLEPLGGAPYQHRVADRLGGGDQQQPLGVQPVLASDALLRAAIAPASRDSACATAPGTVDGSGQRATAGTRRR